MTGLVTGASMTEMLGVRGIWCAGQTTASSSEHTSIPRMTAAKTLMVVEVRALDCLTFVLHVSFVFAKPG